MPLPGFLTDSELQGRLEALLKVPAGTLSSGDSADWAQFISDANKSAYQDIQDVLLKRGLSAAQADTWVRGREFQLDIGLYWALIKGASLHDYDLKTAAALDRRKELLTVGLYDSAGNALKPPVPPAEGQVESGALNTENDLFVADGYDRRRGRVTRW